MKTPTVDYRSFRLSRINQPEFSHLKLLLGWVVYFIFYFLTENLIPPEQCHLIHCRLDDLIPFCEIFLIPYVFWYFLVAGSLLYFLLYHVESFKKLQTYIIITQITAMCAYIFYPSIQDLRPAAFPRQNLFTWGLGIIYAFDTNTGVCPSLHVAYSMGIASVWLKEPGIPKRWKAAVAAVVALICVSVLFIKQHSAVDVFAAIPICLLAEFLVFHRQPRKRQA